MVPARALALNTAKQQAGLLVLARINIRVILCASGKNHQ